jgi:flagellar hook assembly protein FlgD
MVDAGNQLLDSITTDTTIIDTTITKGVNLAEDLILTNYPNPFTTTTTIQFENSSSEMVVLDIFDKTGKKITTLVNEVLPAGIHSFRVDGNLWSGGIYFYTLKTGKYSVTRKMVLMK